MSEKAKEEFQKALERMTNNQYTIELDCAPGGIRPGDLIAGVIKDTGLPVSEPVAKVFGNWTWDYSEVEGIADLWLKAQPILKERISALYNSGRIRYGSW